jgi:xanthine dehydrogenase accessory factor
MAGSVSGGCVEGDVFERALRVLDEGRPALATYGVADELDFEIGLSCGGSVDVLIEPFRGGEVWQSLRRAVEEGHAAALAVALSPDELLGRKLAVAGDETPVGSIDTDLDGQIAVAARHLSADGGTRELTLARAGEEATVFVEGFPPPPRLFIVGATHTAVALCRLAGELGFAVTVIDPRSAFSAAERFPDAHRVLRAWPDEVLDETDLDERCFVVTLSHDPKFDLPTLARALRSDARYVGALGSRATHLRRRERLLQQGFDEGDLARIHAPVGLDIGGRSPEEIALAILAEMVAARYGREGRALSQRREPVGVER